jgi:hypothetical protein
LRKELTIDEVRITPQGVNVPQSPSLGFELNRDALEEFATAARRRYTCATDNTNRRNRRRAEA